MYDPIRVTVQVRIDAIPGTSGAYGNLQISEDFTVPVSTFAQLAEIVGRFHQLAETIEAERNGIGGQGGHVSATGAAASGGGGG
jgi:hypothetical protein